MERSLFQIVTDEVGSNKTHLQEEQEYLDLRCEGISARCTEVPGKEAHQRFQWPRLSLFSIFFTGSLSGSFISFISFFISSAGFFPGRSFFPAEAFPAFIFLRVMITLYIPVTISLLIKK